VLEHGHPSRLVCAECGRESDERAQGWQAYLGGPGAECDPLDVFQRIIFEGERIHLVADVLIYCPTCSVSRAD